MKNLVIINVIFIFTILNAQLQYEGIPKYIGTNNLDQVSMISTIPNQRIVRNEIPKYFVFGDEYKIDIDYFELADAFVNAEGTTYLLSIESIGAKAIGLEMNNFYLPIGSEMYIYNLQGDIVIGAFNSNNNNSEKLFSTSVVKGEKIFIEIFEPIDVFGFSEINISKVIHDFTDIMGYYTLEENDRNSCNLNVACPEADSWLDQVNSVVRMSMGGGLCSASLVNNVEEDLTPYIFTADHCLSGNTNYYVFYFKYQANTCGGSSGPSSYTMTGSTLRANGSGPDFALLELNNSIPESYDPYYNGWNRSAGAPYNPTGIHHPGGEVKKISFTEDVVTGTYYYWEFHYDIGRIYPGSSGSPLFDPNHRTVGVASFMYTDYCYEWNCYCDQQYDVGYGRFDRAWDYGDSPSERLQNWLDPSNTGLGKWELNTLLFGKIILMKMYPLNYIIVMSLSQ